jgi:hypothetical protein
MSQTFIGTIGSVLAVAIIVAGSAYSCGNINDRYYKASAECIASGGSWIPTGGQASYSAACIKK